MAAFPCGKCGKECNGKKDVGCEKCETWYHQKCEQLTNLQFNFLLKTTLPYICSSCCLNSHGNFDFLAGLRRLSSHRCTDNAAYLESIFTRHLAAKMNPKPSLAGQFFEDDLAQNFLVRNPTISRSTRQEMAIAYSMPYLSRSTIPRATH